MSEAAIECRGVGKTFTETGTSLTLFRELDLRIERGERIAIMGRSGAGKSTLLHLLGGLDLPTAGDVRVAGERMSALDEAARGRLRNRALGFVYQFHHLLPEFTALENVALPLLIAGAPVGRARARAAELLGHIGLAARVTHKPGELSGGERQRVAVARALANDPACVLADEPTGNLDRESARQVLELLLALNDNAGATLVIVTHDAELAARMQRVLVLRDGRLVEADAAELARMAGAAGTVGA